MSEDIFPDKIIITPKDDGLFEVIIRIPFESFGKFYHRGIICRDMEQYSEDGSIVYREINTTWKNDD